MTLVDDNAQHSRSRHTPAMQWTSTTPPEAIASSMNAAEGMKCGLKSVSLGTKAKRVSNRLGKLQSAGVLFWVKFVAVHT